MARMIGALGWHGQCACCCGPDEKSTVKAQEEQQWRAEAEDELAAMRKALGHGQRHPNARAGRVQS